MEEEVEPYKSLLELLARIEASLPESPHERNIAGEELNEELVSYYKRARVNLLDVISRFRTWFQVFKGSEGSQMNADLICMSYSFQTSFGSYVETALVTARSLDLTRNLQQYIPIDKGKPGLLYIRVFNYL